MKGLILIFLFIGMVKTNYSTAQSIEIQGHRGARGLLPENSIPAFQKALELGVHTLEMDVVVSKDKKLVVSHEPYFSSEICLDPRGNKITTSSEKKHNIYELAYEEIKKYDCGSLSHPRFPEQKNVPVFKPLLTEVIEASEQYAKENNLPLPRYNIETKILPETDGKYHPGPEDFSNLLYEVVKDKLPVNRLTIQSFDKRILQYWHKTFPGYALAYLVEESINPDEMKQILGFLPQIYSPYFQTLTPELVEAYQRLGVRVIPWTVNELNDLKRMAAWKVDGIITDYPDRAQFLIK